MWFDKDIEPSTGRRIVDERCQCTHRRSEHEDRFAVGHGKCKLCNCPQFTWVSFIYADEPIKRRR